MSRIARVVIPGCPHHIIQRGVCSLPVFFEEQNRDEYLGFLKEQGTRFRVRFHAYCLMNNNIHLIAVPEKAESLARAIGEAHRLYTRMINFRLGVRGYLFQGRFFSCPLDASHLLSAVRYVERSPVRAKMVKDAWNYSWSSAAFHVGIKNHDCLVGQSDLFSEIDDWYSFLATKDDNIDILREKTRTGRPCGADNFLDIVEKITGRDLRPKAAGRPKKQ